MSDLKVRENDEIVRSDRVEPSWRPAVRFLLAVVSAAGISRFLWSLVPNQLSVKTDIVGSPIFADFNATRYTNGYYFIAVGLPDPGCPHIRDGVLEGPSATMARS